MQSVVTPAVFISLSVGVHWAVLSSADFNVSESQARDTTKASLVIGESPAISALLERWEQSPQNEMTSEHFHIKKVGSPKQARAHSTPKPNVYIAEPQVSFANPSKPPRPSGVEPTEYMRNQAYQTSLLKRYGALLRSAIDRKKTYSHPALLKRLEGTVVLNVQVYRSGKLGRIALLQSSGHPHLDDKTLGIVRSIKTIEPAPQRLHGNHFDFTIPIIYRIDE